MTRPPIRAALIGAHIDPSLSPAMHETEGSALGLTYHYDRIDTARSCLDLESILAQAREAACAGVNITHPHKQEILPLLTSLDDRARRIGAVNTVVFKEDGETLGMNTDHRGFARALLRHIGSIQGQTVAQYGAGGAGSAVALALCEAGIRHLLITDTDARKSNALAQRLRGMGWRADAEEVIGSAGIDGAVNCTPVGMAWCPGQVFDPGGLSRDAWVADCVYPYETELVSNARAAGLAVMDGARMALFQMAASFEIFTGTAPDIDRMERMLTVLLADDRRHKA
ncbi:MAG: shikimate dehydrogenase [Rhodobacteraceae bacterium]|nr:shikimate dehydrogenase [Paracoccaceae bacterium]